MRWQLIVGVGAVSLVVSITGIRITYSEPSVMVLSGKSLSGIVGGVDECGETEWVDCPSAPEAGLCGVQVCPNGNTCPMAPGIGCRHGDVTTYEKQTSDLEVYEITAAAVVCWECETCGPGCHTGPLGYLSYCDGNGDFDPQYETAADTGGNVYCESGS